MRLAFVSALLFAVCHTAHAVPGDDLDQLKVGVQPDGRVVLPTNQVLQPAGTQITFPGRPVSLLPIDDGRTLVVQSKNDLVFIDLKARKIRQTLKSPVGLSVIGLAGTSERIFTSGAISVHLNVPSAWRSARCT